MKYVEWIHPSVRDLVIEHLIAHDADRADFLRKASSEGLVLALSTAGGGHGDRALPLLRKDDDWRALHERASEVAASDDYRDHYNLLEAFAPAVRHSSGQSHRQRLIECVTCTLAAMRSRWDGARGSIPPAVLRPYCVVSEATEPLVPLPDLRPTWQTTTTAAQVDADPPENPTAADLLDVAEWLVLAQLIARYEPRLLRQVGFSARYSGFLAALIGGAATWLDDVVAPEPQYDDETDEPLGVSSEDEENEAIIVALEGPLRNVAYLVPSLSSECDVLVERCRTLADEFGEVEREREEWHERQAEEALEDWESRQAEEDQNDGEDDVTEPTIEEMFADL